MLGYITNIVELKKKIIKYFHLKFTYKLFNIDHLNNEDPDHQSGFY